MSDEVEAAVELSEIDWLLQSYVQEANALDAPFVSITLLSGGQIISGTLVSAAEYMRQSAKHFNPTDEPPIDGTWAHFLLETAKAHDEVPKEVTEFSPQYIHLRDAKIFSNGQKPLPSNEGIWWRGMLKSVDGFWMGRLKTSDE